MSLRDHKDTLTLSDAERLAGPLSFNLMIKPAGSLCNLGCSYCYYLDKAEIYSGREPVMSIDMLETVIRKYIETCETPEVTFNWHGGEPLVLGKDFFRKVLEFERRYADGKVIHNTMQTNGILLDSEWAAILRDGNFLTGISVDGPAEIHDRFRRDRRGGPTLDKVLRGIAVLQEAGAEFNTMTTINKASEGKGALVYEFLKSIGSRYMQFMPVLEHVKDGRIVPPGTPGSETAPWSVSAIGFGQFMCDMFDRWIRHDVGKYFVGHFDAALAGWCGVQPERVHMQKHPGKIPEGDAHLRRDDPFRHLKEELPSGEVPQVPMGASVQRRVPQAQIFRQRRRTGRAQRPVPRL